MGKSRSDFHLLWERSSPRKLARRHQHAFIVLLWLLSLNFTSICGCPRELQSPRFRQYRLRNDTAVSSWINLEHWPQLYLARYNARNKWMHTRKSSRHDLLLGLWLSLTVTLDAPRRFSVYNFKNRQFQPGYLHALEKIYTSLFRFMYLN